MHTHTICISNPLILIIAYFWKLLLWILSGLNLRSSLHLNYIATRAQVFELSNILDTFRHDKSIRAIEDGWGLFAGVSNCLQNGIQIDVKVVHPEILFGSTEVVTIDINKRFIL